jgi:hypothetical protein
LPITPSRACVCDALRFWISLDEARRLCRPFGAYCEAAADDLVLVPVLEERGRSQ